MRTGFLLSYAAAALWAPTAAEANHNGPPTATPLPVIRPAPPAPPPPAPPPPAPRPFPPASSWPPLSNLEVRSQPDWTDDAIYPPEARDLDQEGNVTVADLVGPDGVPKMCRILVSSGHKELDEGTCRLFMKMRFAPPRDAQGRPTEAWFGRRIVWVMTDYPNPLVPSSMAAHLRIWNGTMSSCTLTGSGPFLRDWSKTTCLVLARTLDYYFGRHLPTTREATIFVDLMPAGMRAPSHEAPSRRLIASRRTEFTLKRDGDVTNCRSPVHFGFGKPREDHASPCGYFMNAPWFEEAPSPRKGEPSAPPREGAIEVKVFVEG